MGSAILLAGSLAPAAHAEGFGDRHDIRHVLLVSIDGMHALDYINCLKGAYCPNIAGLGEHAVSYLDTSTSKPSDSFPGLTAIVRGSSPRARARHKATRTAVLSVPAFGSSGTAFVPLRQCC